MIETCNKYPKPEMVKRLAKILGIESHKLFSVNDDTDEALDRLRRLIIKDVKIIVSEAVDEIKSFKTIEHKQKNKK